MLIVGLCANMFALLAVSAMLRRYKERSYRTHMPLYLNSHMTFTNASQIKIWNS